MFEQWLCSKCHTVILASYICVGQWGPVYGVSLHCTSVIMIQLLEDRSSHVASTDVIVTENAENTITQSRTRKRRSFQPVQSVIKPHTGGMCQTPNVIPALETSSIELTSTFSVILDQIWCLARFHSWTSTGTKKIPNYTGFNCLIHPVECTDDVHTVSGLSSINQSQTRMDTVLQVLKVNIQKAKKLFLGEVYIVFDHALYSKALEIIMNQILEDLRGFCNIRMGPFHAIMEFLAVNDLRFGETGSHDIGRLAESCFIRKSLQFCIAIAQMYILSYGP